MSGQSVASRNSIEVAVGTELRESQGAGAGKVEVDPVAPHSLADVSPGGRGRIPPKLYRIGEVVEYSGVSRQTIHNYTTMGLLCESRWTRGGHRLYDESAFERLDKIAELKAQNKSLEEIRQYFAGLGER